VRRGPISEAQQMGGEVLSSLAFLLSDSGLVESFRLFLGSKVKPITLLWTTTPDGYREIYLIDNDRQLIYKGERFAIY